MERLSKIHDRYTKKEFRKTDGFNAYSIKENEVRKKTISDYPFGKFNIGRGFGVISCRYQIDLEPERVVDFKLEKEFKELAEKWEDDTGLYSTITPKVVNEYFFDLLLLGRDKKIISLILDRLRSGAPTQWHLVLKAITKQNPVPADQITRSQKIREFWVSWGIANSYIK